MISSLEMMGYFPLELLAVRKGRFEKLRVFGRSVLIFLSLMEKMQQENVMNCGPMGLMGDFEVSVQDQPRLSRLLGPKKQAAAARDTVGRFDKFLQKMPGLFLKANFILLPTHSLS